MALRFLARTACLYPRCAITVKTFLECSQLKQQPYVSMLKIQAAHLQTISSQNTSLADPEEMRDEPALLLTEEDKKDFFRLNELFTVEDLFNARAHFGHKEGLLDPHMRPYIYGKRLGVLIFDLEKTAALMRKALTVTAEIAYRKGIILLMNRSRQTGYLVENAAKECGEYAYCRRWQHKVLTNSEKVFGTVTRLPDLIIMFTTLHVSNETHKAVSIAAKMLIPTIGICDTNSNPTLITYPVPANDDTPQAIEFYCHLFKTAILNGKAKRKEIIEKYGEDFYNKTLEFS